MVLGNSYDKESEDFEDDQLEESCGEDFEDDQPEAEKDGPCLSQRGEVASNKYNSGTLTVRFSQSCFFMDLH